MPVIALESDDLDRHRALLPCHDLWPVLRIVVDLDANGDLQDLEVYVENESDEDGEPTLDFDHDRAGLVEIVATVQETFRAEAEEARPRPHLLVPYVPRNIDTRGMTRSHRPNIDRWVPACGGTETWARARDGREYLYVWWENAPESTPAALRHGWLDRNDVIRHDDPNG